MNALINLNLYMIMHSTINYYKDWYNKCIPGRHTSVTVGCCAENIDSVRELIRQDSHVTYYEIEAILGMTI